MNFQSSYSLWVYKTCAFSEFPSSPQKRLCEAEIFFFFKFLKQKETDSKIFYFPSKSYRLSHRAQQKSVAIKILINTASDGCEIFRSTHIQKCIQRPPFFSGSTIRPPQLNVRTKRLALACAQRPGSCPGSCRPCPGSPAATTPRPAPNPPRRPWAPPQRPACASCTCAGLPGAGPPFLGQSCCPGERRPNPRRPGRRGPSPCRRPASPPLPAPFPFGKSRRKPSGPHPALPRPPAPAPHLLLALAAEAQARGPLLVAVAVVGAGLVRLELHHPPGPGGGAVRGLGVRRGGACCGRSRARAPGLAEGGGEEGLCVRYTAPRRASLIAPGPGPAPQSRPPSPSPPPPLPPPPPTTTAPPFWARCVSGVRARGLAGPSRVRGAGGVRESRPPRALGAKEPLHRGAAGAGAAATPTA